MCRPPDLLHLDVLAVEILHHRRLRLGDALAEFDVGAAAGHVRRDRDRARLTRVRDDLRLALVVLRVQHVVLQAAALNSFDSVSDASTLVVPISTG